MEEASADFSSVLHFAVDLARNLKLVREKVLLLSMPDVIAKIVGVITKDQKDTLGSSDVEVGEVLELERKIRALKMRGSDEYKKDPLVKQYCQEMKASNLIDPFDVYNALKGAERIEMTDLMPKENVVFYSPNFGPKSVEKEVCELLFPDASWQQIEVETPLDASLVENIAADEVNLSLRELPFSDVVSAAQSSVSRKTSSSTTEYCDQWIEGYLRLVVNSRDELALARIICGPCGLLDHKAFTAIKNEAAKINMPMYQVNHLLFISSPAKSDI